MTNPIEIRTLGMTYPRAWFRPAVPALKGISLTVAQGEAYGFVGPNGAGKSTTLRILTGLLRPTAGSVQLFGLPVSDPQSRRGLGYVPESPYLNDYLTPLETLRIAYRLHHPDERFPDKHCLHWLDRLGLSAVAKRGIRTFSKGMTQRVALAQAMCISPRLLILDEPLSGLDPLGRRDVVDLLAEYKQGGGTLFFTSHVLHDVERLADRFGLIHRGELISARSPHELLMEDQQVVLRSAGEAGCEGMTADGRGRWRGECAVGQVWLQLGRLQAAGHQIIEIRPTLDLEAVFVKLASSRQPSDA